MQKLSGNFREQFEEQVKWKQRFQHLNPINIIYSLNKKNVVYKSAKYVYNCEKMSPLTVGHKC